MAFRKAWRDLSEIEPGTGAYDHISYVLELADFDYLKKRALEVRKGENGQLSQEITCEIGSRDSKFAHGMTNVVLMVEFSDGLRWIARVEHGDGHRDGPRQCAFESEVKTMRELRRKTTIPVPEVFDYDWNPMSPFGFPYMLMEYMPGQTLRYHFVQRISQRHRPKVATQLADMLLQLQKITDNCIGYLINDPDSEKGWTIRQSFFPQCSDPIETSCEYYSLLLDKHISQVVHDHPNDPEWTTAYWIIKSAITHFLDTNRLNGPFPLRNAALHFSNLLFDEEYNLTGVISWGHAQTVPLERLLSNEELRIYPAVPADTNRSIKAFRRLLAEALEAKERAAYIAKVYRSAQTGHENGSANDAMELDVVLAALMRSEPIGDTWFSESAKFLMSEHYDIACLCMRVNAHTMYEIGKIIAKWMYKDRISWEALVQFYGSKEVGF